MKENLTYPHGFIKPQSSPDDRCHKGDDRRRKKVVRLDDDDRKIR